MIVRIFWWAKVIKKMNGGGKIKCIFWWKKNILVRYFADFINVNPTIH